MRIFINGGEALFSGFTLGEFEIFRHCGAIMAKIGQKTRGYYGAKPSSSTLAWLELPGWGRFWHFGTCNGVSKFLTLNANSIGASGPISKWGEALFLHFGLAFRLRVGSILAFRDL